MAGPTGEPNQTPEEPQRELPQEGEGAGPDMSSKERRDHRNLFNV